MKFNKSVLTSNLIASVLLMLPFALTMKRSVLHDSTIFFLSVIVLANTAAFYTLWYFYQTDHNKARHRYMYLLLALGLIACIIMKALGIITTAAVTATVVSLPICTVIMYAVARFWACFFAHGKTDESLMDNEEKESFKLLKENQTTVKSQFFITLAAGLVNLIVGWQKGKTYQNYPTLFKVTFFIITLGFGILWHTAVEAALQNPDKIAGAAIDVLGDD